MLPAFCYGHPCEFHVESVEHSMVESEDSDGCPFNHETDNCETTCCCAGHFPASIFAEIPYAELTSTMMPYEPHLALPRLLDRIFVPPQNHA